MSWPSKSSPEAHRSAAILAVVRKTTRTPQKPRSLPKKSVNIRDFIKLCNSKPWRIECHLNSRRVEPKSKYFELPGKSNNQKNPKYKIPSKTSVDKDSLWKFPVSKPWRVFQSHLDSHYLHSRQMEPNQSIRPASRTTRKTLNIKFHRKCPLINDSLWKLLASKPQHIFEVI